MHFLLLMLANGCKNNIFNLRRQTFFILFGSLVFLDQVLVSFEWDSYSNGECQISSVKKLSREKCELSKAEKDIPVNLWVGKRHGERGVGRGGV